MIRFDLYALGAAEAAWYSAACDSSVVGARDRARGQHPAGDDDLHWGGHGGAALQARIASHRSKQKLKRIAGIVLLLAGIVILAWVVYRPGWGSVAAAAASANWSTLGAGAVVCLVSLAIRAMKWHLVMRSYGWVTSYWQSLGLYGLACCLGAVTPARAGELSGSVALRSIVGVRLGHGTGMILADRVLEGLALLVAVGASSLRLGLRYPMPGLRWSLLGAGVACGFAVLVVMFMLRSVGRIAALLARVSARLGGRPRRVAERLSRFFKDLGLARDILSAPRMCGTLFGLTLLAWGLDFAFGYAVTVAVLPAGLMDVVSAQSLSVAAGVVSGIPAGLGVTALGYVELMQAQGYPAAAVTAAAAVGGLLRLALTVVAGLLSARLAFRASGKVAPVGGSSCPV